MLRVLHAIGQCVKAIGKYIHIIGQCVKVIG